MLPLQLPLLEARLRLFRAALASYVSRFPLHRLPLIRERLLRLGAHRWLLKCFRRLAGASLGVLAGLLASVESWPKNESLAHLLTTNRRISSSDGSAPKTMRAAPYLPSSTRSASPTQNWPS